MAVTAAAASASAKQAAGCREGAFSARGGSGGFFSASGIRTASSESQGCRRASAAVARDDGEKSSIGTINSASWEACTT